MNVICFADDCRYINCGSCSREYISLDEYRECEDYESYLDTEEWKKPFWKRMRDDENHRVCRVKYYGKEIEVKGRKFFAESKSDYAHLTDEITGMRCGQLAYIEDNLDSLIKAARNVDVPLLELPIATYDEKSRTFHYEDEDGAE